jgi:hypothetical protein
VKPVQKKGTGKFLLEISTDFNTNNLIDIRIPAFAETQKKTIGAIEFPFVTFKFKAHIY